MLLILLEVRGVLLSSLAGRATSFFHTLWMVVTMASRSVKYHHNGGR